MFIRTKRQKKNGKVYLYRYQEWREWDPMRKKVRSHSKFLGKIDWTYTLKGDGAAQCAEPPAAKPEPKIWSQQEFLEQTKGPAEDAGPEDVTPSSGEAEPHSS